MANFQCLLESPFHWLAHFSGGLFKPSRTSGRTRRERALRRDHLNG